MLKNKNIFGFTLVELIVVITIVGILSTVGFVSYSGYLTGARDSNRFSQLTKLSDSLQVYAATKSLPLPDDYIEVTASGTVIAYQGYVGVDVLETIDYTNGGKDPKDGSYFTYYLKKDRNSIQLLAFMEEQSSISYINNQTFAVDYTERVPKVYGKKLGVLTEVVTNTPVQEISGITALDIVSTPNYYVSHLSDSKKLEGTGAILQASIPNASCKRIKEMGKSQGNGTYEINPGGIGEFTVYCDMDTDGGGWTRVPQNMMQMFGTDATVTISDIGEKISVSVIADGGGTYCGGATNGFELQIYLKKALGNFSEILYKQDFENIAACWAVLGDNNSFTYNTNINPDLNSIKFLESNRMGGENGNAFVGDTHRCDNESENFWHGDALPFGTGDITMTVVQKLLNTTSDTYISTHSTCGGGNAVTTFTNISIR